MSKQKLIREEKHTQKKTTTEKRKNKNDKQTRDESGEMK